MVIQPSIGALGQVLIQRIQGLGNILTEIFLSLPSSNDVFHHKMPGLLG